MNPVRAFLLPLLLASVGCGWSEDHFLVEGIPAWCEEAASCVGFEAEACIDHVRAVDRKSCDFDGRSAKKCVKALEEEGTCVDNGDLGTFSYVGPEACDLVWDGCPLFEVPIDEGTSPPPPETE